MVPLFTNLANKTNTADIMKELKERREQKSKVEDKEIKKVNEDMEEGDQEKMNRFGNILIQGALKKRNFVFNIHHHEFY